jgi:uncharacterized protein (DUF1778 family)
MLRTSVSMDEKYAIENAASITGLTVSSWIRERIIYAALQEIEDALPYMESLQRIYPNRRVPKK